MSELTFNLTTNNGTMKNADKSITAHVWNDNTVGAEGGLTKREYFAGLAMRGILASLGQANDTKYHVNGGFLSYEIVAKESVFQAYALLSELEKTESK
jgi:hypothetical protein